MTVFRDFSVKQRRDWPWSVTKLSKTKARLLARQPRKVEVYGRLCLGTTNHRALRAATLKDLQSLVLARLLITLR